MQRCGRPRPATTAASLKSGAVQSGRSARRAVEPLGEFNDRAFRSADVAEEEYVLEVDDLPDRFPAGLSDALDDAAHVVDGEGDVPEPSTVRGRRRLLSAGGRRVEAHHLEHMSLPSGEGAIMTSTVTFSRPMIRSIHSPLNTAGSPQSKPSGARNRTVSSRFSTTRPTWTKLVTPGRWLSIEVKRLARDRWAAGVVRISAARADLERALAARRCVDELGVRPFRRHRPVRRGCCVPGRPCPSNDRPRSRRSSTSSAPASGAIHRRSQRRTPPQCSRWHIGPDHCRNGRISVARCMPPMPSLYLL